VSPYNRRWVILVVGVFFSLNTGCGQIEPEEEGTISQLNHDTFKAAIQPILDNRGCSQAGCHYRDKNDPNAGGPGGSFRIFECTGNSCTPDQLLANHDSAAGMANIANPASSKLLTKPLAEPAGGIQHLGGDLFLSTGDTDYMAILSWIQSPL